MTRGPLGTTYMVVNPQGPVAHIENFAIFPFILANIAGTSLFRTASGGGFMRIYSIRIPEIARLITNCWICSVPSKMS